MANLGRRPLVLGRVLELWARKGRHGVDLHQPSGERWALYHPAAHRLELVQLGDDQGDGDEDAQAAAAEWSWGDSEGRQVSYHAPDESGSTACGRLAAIVYVATKGGQKAEWEHWFRSPPQLHQADGEYFIRGRVVADSRGIVS